MSTLAQEGAGAGLRDVVGPHAMTGFLGPTSTCGRIGRRGGIEFRNGAIVDSDLGVECELVRPAF